MGPEIFAWIWEDGLINGLRKSGLAAARWFAKKTRQTKNWAQAVRRLAVTSISTFISGL
jgi:hypothetical protein